MSSGVSESIGWGPSFSGAEEGSTWDDELCLTGELDFLCFFFEDSSSDPESSSEVGCGLAADVLRFLGLVSCLASVELSDELEEEDDKLDSDELDAELAEDAESESRDSSSKKRRSSDWCFF